MSMSIAIALVLSHDLCTRLDVGTCACGTVHSGRV